MDNHADHLKTWLSPSDITFDGNFLNLFTKAGNLRAWSFAPVATQSSNGDAVGFFSFHPQIRVV
jgi:hypothetical protein